MCGRFTLATGDLGAVRSRFGLDELVDVRPRYDGPARLEPAPAPLSLF